MAPCAAGLTPPAADLIHFFFFSVPMPNVPPAFTAGRVGASCTTPLGAPDPPCTGLGRLCVPMCKVPCGRPDPACRFTICRLLRLCRRRGDQLVEVPPDHLHFR